MASLAVVGFSSCDDTLDVEPKDSLSQEGYFKTETDLEMFSNPFYNDIPVKDFFTEQSDQLVQRVFSDEIIGGNQRYTPKEGSGSNWEWSTNSFKRLRRINELLQNIDKCESASARDLYTGVARFFRAYFYFEKVRHYGDVQWTDKPVGSSDKDILYKPRDSREFVMTKIIEDIDAAIELLRSKDDQKEAPYRVTIGAALALKSRICLFEGTWRKYHKLSYPEHDYNYYLELAADAAKQLMDRKEYSITKLSGNPDKDYRDLFNQDVADKGEYIWSRVSSDAPQVNGTRHNANAFTTVQSQGRPGLTRKFVCTYLMRDGSRFTDKDNWKTMEFKDEMKDRDPRLAQSIRGLNYSRVGSNDIVAPDMSVSCTGYQPTKFVLGSSYDKTDVNTNDLPWIRYAEVLLNYAEAKAELGTLTQEDLNNSIGLLRDRVSMPALSLTNANANPDPYLDSYFPGVTGSNKGVILEIRRERGIELLMEGFRLGDLFRWKAGSALSKDLVGMYFPGPGSYDLTGDGKPDVALFNTGEAKPAGATYVFEIGKEFKLTDGNKGYYDFHQSNPHHAFNEERDYLYPIPANQIALNPNLVQNPGWE